MVFGGVWMVAFWAIIVALLVWGITRITGRGEPSAVHATPLEIAQRRFASGEIGRAELDELTHALR